ncbi:MAG: ChaN family lipoprotein [Fimbriimonadaceae bacterium]|nr:ChaN family lipoprotein [Fimbriimonadaceae bacterium]
MSALASILIASTHVLFQGQPATASDPNRLSIGRPGTLRVELGKIRSTQSGKLASPDDVAAAADGHRFVFLGELHDNPDHHKMQATVIEALAKRGRNVIVGFEMFTRPVQDNLNGWTLGWWSEEEFIEKSDWKKQWGFDFALYRPIFEATKKYRLPMVAMNVPREWVRQTGREGFKSLSSEIRAQVPEPDLTNQNHRAVFTALMGGHPMTGERAEFVYSAQVLWDAGMADTALKYLAKSPTISNTVFVVVAGAGHVMYGQGINYQIQKRTGETGITMTMIEGTDSEEVSRGIGDYVYVAAAPKRG